jgi:Ca2+-binding RTX toxin-like protein
MPGIACLSEPTDVSKPHPFKVNPRKAHLLRGSGVDLSKEKSAMNSTRVHLSKRPGLHQKLLFLLQVISLFSMFLLCPPPSHAQTDIYGVWRPDTGTLELVIRRTNEWSTEVEREEGRVVVWDWSIESQSDPYDDDHPAPWGAGVQTPVDATDVLAIDIIIEATSDHRTGRILMDKVSMADFPNLSSITGDFGSVMETYQKLMYEGSEFPDNIYSASCPLEARGYAGDDHFFGGGFSILYGGEGNDLLETCSVGENKIYGEAGDDVLTIHPWGFWGDNYLYGGDGNDVFKIFHGNWWGYYDYLDGGNGDDEYRLSNGDIVIVESTDSPGIDSLILETPDTRDLTIDIDYSTLSVSDATLSVRTGEGPWTPSPIVLEEIRSGKGNDTFLIAEELEFPGHLDGGEGHDTLDYSAYSSPVTISLATPSATGLKSFENIELILGGASDSDQLIVSGVFEIDGPDSSSSTGFQYESFENLLGSPGDDTFVFLEGGSVSGSLNGGEGEDEISYSTLVTDVTVDLYAATATHVGGFIFYIENITGGFGNDHLTGNYGDNILVPGGGNNTLAGGWGNDTYIFSEGFGSDTVIEAAGEGADTFDLSAATSALSFVLDHSGLTISDGVNSISTLDNQIEFLLSGAGDDVFSFAAEDITLADGAGSFDGGGGVNMLDYSGLSSSVYVDLNEGIAAGLSEISNIQNISGGTGDDILIGDSGNNILIGNSGNDDLSGLAGDDIYRFAEGWGSGDVIHESTDEGWDTLDFSALTVSATFTISSITVTDGISSVFYGGNHLEKLVGGQADDVFDVIESATITLDGDEGSDGYSINIGSLSGTVALADTGTSGTDTVTIHGTNADEIFLVSPATVAQGPGLVSYDGNIETLAVYGYGGDDDFSPVSPSESTEISVHGGSETVEDTLTYTEILAGSSVHIPRGTGAGTIQEPGRRPVHYSGIEYPRIVSADSEMTVGNVTVSAEAVLDLGGNQYQAIGAIEFNSLIRTSGPVLIDQSAVSISGEGQLSVNGIPSQGKLTFLDGAYTIHADFGPNTAQVVPETPGSDALTLSGIDIGLSHLVFDSSEVWVKGWFSTPSLNAPFDGLRISQADGVSFSNGQITLGGQNIFSVGDADFLLDHLTFSNLAATNISSVTDFMVTTLEIFPGGVINATGEFQAGGLQASFGGSTIQFLSDRISIPSVSFTGFPDQNHFSMNTVEVTPSSISSRNGSIDAGGLAISGFNNAVITHEGIAVTSASVSGLTGSTGFTLRELGADSTGIFYDCGALSHHGFLIQLDEGTIASSLHSDTGILHASGKTIALQDVTVSPGGVSIVGGRTSFTGANAINYDLTNFSFSSSPRQLTLDCASPLVAGVSDFDLSGIIVHPGGEFHVPGASFTSGSLAVHLSGANLQDNGAFVTQGTFSCSNQDLTVSKIRVDRRGINLDRQANLDAFGLTHILSDGGVFDSRGLFSSEGYTPLGTRDKRVQWYEMMVDLQSVSFGDGTCDLWSYIAGQWTGNPANIVFIAGIPGCISRGTAPRVDSQAGLDLVIAIPLPSNLLSSIGVESFDLATFQGTPEFGYGLEDEYIDFGGSFRLPSAMMQISPSTISGDISFEYLSSSDKLLASSRLSLDSILPLSIGSLETAHLEADLGIAGGRLDTVWVSLSSTYIGIPIIPGILDLSKLAAGIENLS